MLKQGLAEAQHIAQMGSWVWEIQQKILIWSDEIYRIFGVPQQEFDVTYETFLNCVHPDDREFVIQAINDALEKKKPYSIDHRILLPEGSERIVHGEAKLSFDDTGMPIRMLGTIQVVEPATNLRSHLIAGRAGARSDHSFSSHCQG